MPSFNCDAPTFSLFNPTFKFPILSEIAFNPTPNSLVLGSKLAYKPFNPAFNCEIPSLTVPTFEIKLVVPAAKFFDPCE